MSAHDRSFSENLDLLIKLLRKMKDNSQLDDHPGVPKMFFTNFDFVLKNYENMKGQITQQLLNQFGDPIKEMVADMVEQLKEELGEEDLIQLEAEMKQKEAPETKIPTEKDYPDVSKAIAEIDRQLKGGDLTPEQVDRLLDERTRLRSKLKQDGD